MIDIPLISVIVPVYNVEIYLETCILSITNQTYENLEIILIDDGSTDSCPAICDKWSENDRRIKVIHKKNGGLSDARNTGIDIAKGEYFIFVDSDDKIKPQMISALYRCIVENNCKISLCNIICTDDNYQPLKENGDIIPQGVYSSKDVIIKLANQSFSWKWVVAWNKIYHRSLFENLRYPKGKYHEDEYLIVPLLLQVEKVAVISEELYYYVQREGSIMSEGVLYRRLNSIEAFFLRLEYLSKIGREDLIKNFEKDIFWRAFPIITSLDCSSKECRTSYYCLSKVYRRVFRKINKYCDFSKMDLWIRLKMFWLPHLFVFLSIMKGRKNRNVR